MEMYAEAYLESSRTSTDGDLCENHISFIVDIRLSSKYASGIGSNIGKFYTMSIFV